MFKSSYLDDIKRRAIRSRVWFKTLDGLERGIINLSVKVLDSTVTLSRLDNVLSIIIAKIEDALKGEFEKRLESYGLNRAGEIVDIAIRLGHVSALGWLNDGNFARYVTFMSLN